MNQIQTENMRFGLWLFAMIILTIFTVGFGFLVLTDYIIYNDSLTLDSIFHTEDDLIKVNTERAISKFQDTESLWKDECVRLVRSFCVTIRIFDEDASAYSLSYDIKTVKKSELEHVDGLVSKTIYDIKHKSTSPIQISGGMK